MTEGMTTQTFYLTGDIRHAGVIKVEATSLDEALDKADGGDFEVFDEQHKGLAFDFAGHAEDADGNDLDDLLWTDREQNADPAEHAIEQSLRFGYDPEQEPPPTCIDCGDPMEYVQLSPIGNARGWLHTGPKHHDHEARPVPQPVLDCVAAGTHLTSCDSDGYCNACGHQEGPLWDGWPGDKERI